MDGVNIFPKLPVHIRTHRDTFERNQRAKKCYKRAETGIGKLKELNSVMISSADDDVAPVGEAATLPQIQPEAMHNDEYVITAGMRIGAVADTIPKKRHGNRGKDKGKRALRSCPRCKIKKPEWKNKCKGRARADLCDYYDNEGKSRCGRCYTRKGMHAYECIAA